MEIPFTADEELQLLEIARHRGVSVDQLVQDVVERLLDEDRQFREAVQIGIDAADRGDFVESAEVWRRVEAIRSLEYQCDGLERFSVRIGGAYRSRLQRSGSEAVWDLGLRPRLV